MSKVGIGKVIAQGPARTRFAVIPARVAGDSAFPFEDGEETLVRIEGRYVIIGPLEGPIEEDEE